MMNSEDKDKIYALYGLVGDWSLCTSVINHLEPYLKELRGIHVKEAYLHMGSGQNYRVKSAMNSRVGSVIVKLTDTSVITFQLKQVYQVESSFHLGNLSKKQKKVAKMVNDNNWSVYVVVCADKSLYCGISTNVERRVREHNKGARGAKYTRSRRPVKLINQWFAGSNSQAKAAEKRFKKLSRQEKLSSLNLTENDINNKV